MRRPMTDGGALRINPRAGDVIIRGLKGWLGLAKMCKAKGTFLYHHFHYYYYYFRMWLWLNTRIRDRRKVEGGIGGDGGKEGAAGRGSRAGDR